MWSFPWRKIIPSPLKERLNPDVPPHEKIRPTFPDELFNESSAGIFHRYLCKRKGCDHDFSTAQLFGNHCAREPNVLTGQWRHTPQTNTLLKGETSAYSMPDRLAVISTGFWHLGYVQLQVRHTI